MLFESRESESLTKGKQALGVELVLFFGKFGNLGGALLKSTRSEIFYLQGKKQQLLIEACLFVCLLHFITISLCLGGREEMT